MKRNREFNRVFQAFGKRRIASGFFGKSPGTILLFLLMTPYLVTFLFGNLREGGWDRADGESPHGTGESRFVVSNHAAFGSESIPLEAYVADKLARSMDDGCEMEALKAQAVLIRSGLVASLYEPDGDVRGSRIGIQDTDYGSVPAGKRRVFCGQQRIYPKRSGALSGGISLFKERAMQPGFSLRGFHEHDESEGE